MDANTITPSVPAIAGVDFLLVPGGVKQGGRKGVGKLLITRNAVFAFSEGVSAASTGAVAGGMLGALVGMLIDNLRKPAEPAEDFRQDPDLQRLGEPLLKKLQRATQVAKLPLDRSLSIRRTGLGFEFSQGEEPLSYSGLINKGKITNFLTGLGFDVR